MIHNGIAVLSFLGQESEFGIGCDCEKYTSHTFTSFGLVAVFKSKSLPYGTDTVIYTQYPPQNSHSSDFASSFFSHFNQFTYLSLFSIFTLFTPYISPYYPFSPLPITTEPRSTARSWAKAEKMSARDLIENEALLDDEEDDESFDEEAGDEAKERTTTNGHYDDSSEEEDDDDEEAARDVSFPFLPDSHRLSLPLTSLRP